MEYKRTDLNEKQDAIYEFLCDYHAEHGYSPSIREIAKQVGLSSTSMIHFYLRQLEEKGYIKRNFGIPRAIQIM